MTSRALLAVALFLGFYATGLSLAATLAWLPWAQSHYTGEVDPWGALAAVGAVYVLWALVPPRVKWVAPGPELLPSEQPRLHGLIKDTAGRVAHPLPAAVYLTATANAFAASRPRWFGLRREPILGVGLPLFAVLGEREWAAVLGHEFGHHTGGDVRLGPWQHGTHRAIAAALQRLDGSAVFLHLPFYVYGRIFLRIAGAASREQELRADALAGGLAGPEAIGRALWALERHDGPWAAYWHGILCPAVEAGFLPPILEGYRIYLASRPLPAADGARSRRAAPDDTHPPLDVRLNALGLDSVPRDGDPGAPAVLLDQPAATEERLLGTLLSDPARLAQLTRIGWTEWGSHIAPAVWERALGPRMEALSAVPLSSLPTLLPDDAGWWPRLHGGVNIYSPEARRRQLQGWLSLWTAVSLLQAGFRVTSGPGAEPALERGDVRVEPFRCVEDLAAGRTTPREWAALVS